jgi:hypothetical protein
MGAATAPGKRAAPPADAAAANTARRVGRFIEVLVMGRISAVFLTGRQLQRPHPITSILLMCFVSAPH